MIDTVETLSEYFSRNVRGRFSCFQKYQVSCLAYAKVLSVLRALGIIHWLESCCSYAYGANVRGCMPGPHDLVSEEVDFDPQPFTMADIQE